MPLLPARPSEDLLVAAKDRSAVDQQSNRVVADRSAHGAPLCGVRGHLLRYDVESRLAQPLADTL